VLWTTTVVGDDDANEGVAYRRGKIEGVKAVDECSNVAAIKAMVIAFEEKIIFVVKKKNQKKIPWKKSSPELGRASLVDAEVCVIDR